MNDETRERLLKIALVAIGVIFFFIYPLGMVWPSGWLWHGGGGLHYLGMMCGLYGVLGPSLMSAAREPSQHRTLTGFTVWWSVVPPGIMGVVAISDRHETGHLVGDVPA